MKQVSVFILLFIFYSGYTQVILSEFQSSNHSTISDEWGDFDDWIELYNPNNHAVNIEGMVLKNNAHIWGIPTGDTNTLLSPYSCFLIWADHEESEGLFHANFRLSASESLIICESDSNTVIDSVEIPSLADDVSYGICPDGKWRIFNDPSPMEENNCESTVNQAISTNDILIYPKITRDKIYVKIPDNLKDRVVVKMISVSGNILTEKSFVSEEPTISLETYNNGMYILLLSTKNNIWKEKIIKLK
ncbi:MAG: T9SS type A sorting domain-containing protein [Bacteroidales bacterium]|nr:T9SS type A sorting domain-containing protein [Bacteroidales bacterium]